LLILISINEQAS